MAENITVDPKDAQDNKIMGILAYLGILVLVPILAAKESPFARYHSNQGLILCITWIVVVIVFMILAIPLALAGLGLLAYLLQSVIYLGLLILIILGIVNAAKGECKPLPLIGNLFTIIK